MHKLGNIVANSIDVMYTLNNYYEYDYRLL